MGAGRPKFRIWLTMSAGRNAKVTAGNSFASLMRKSWTIFSVDSLVLGKAYENIGIGKVLPGQTCCR